MAKQTSIHSGFQAGKVQPPLLFTHQNVHYWQSQELYSSSPQDVSTHFVGSSHGKCSEIPSCMYYYYQSLTSCWRWILDISMGRMRLFPQSCRIRQNKKVGSDRPPPVGKHCTQYQECVKG